MFKMLFHMLNIDINTQEEVNQTLVNDIWVKAGRGEKDVKQK